jgi:peptidoglycan hydrolase CwlO-like protein
MTNSSIAVSPVVQRVVLCLLAATLLTDLGCVSRRAYEQIKAETIEHTQALGAAQEDIKELDQQIAGLQAANRHEDAIAGELRATIQREEEQLPIMRQQAEERLSSLKTQVASLLNQSWHLARKIADIRDESASLQTMAARYKQEIEEAHASLRRVASHSTKPSVTHTRPAESEPSIPALPPIEDIAPPQVAQAVSPAPNLAPVAPSASSSSSVNVEPSTTNDSWIGMITSWLLALWNWLIS